MATGETRRYPETSNWVRCRCWVGDLGRTQLDRMKGILTHTLAVELHLSRKDLSIVRFSNQEMPVHFDFGLFSPRFLAAAP